MLNVEDKIFDILVTFIFLPGFHQLDFGWVCFERVSLARDGYVAEWMVRVTSKPTVWRVLWKFRYTSVFLWPRSNDFLNSWILFTWELYDLCRRILQNATNKAAEQKKMPTRCHPSHHHARWTPMCDVMMCHLPPSVALYSGLDMDIIIRIHIQP